MQAKVETIDLEPISNQFHDSNSYSSVTELLSIIHQLFIDFLSNFHHSLNQLSSTVCQRFINFYSAVFSAF